jgi:hypothetical protein
MNRLKPHSYLGRRIRGQFHWGKWLIRCLSHISFELSTETTWFHCLKSSPVLHRVIWEQFPGSATLLRISIACSSMHSESYILPWTDWVTGLDMVNFHHINQRIQSNKTQQRYRRNHRTHKKRTAKDMTLMSREQIAHLYCGGLQNNTFYSGTEWAIKDWPIRIWFISVLAHVKLKTKRFSTQLSWMLCKK